MPKPPNLQRPVKLNTTLPEDVRAKLDLHLWSDLEKRVPHGAYQRFILARIAEYFDSATFDLAPYADTAPGTVVVFGNTDALKVLKKTLDELSLEKM